MIILNISLYILSNFSMKKKCIAISVVEKGAKTKPGGGWMLRRASFADQPQREGTTAAPVAYGAGPCPSQALAPISPDRTPYRADHYPVRGLPSGLHSWGLRSLLQDPK